MAAKQAIITDDNSLPAALFFGKRIDNPDFYYLFKDESSLPEAREALTTVEFEQRYTREGDPYGAPVAAALQAWVDEFVSDEGRVNCLNNLRQQKHKRKGNEQAIKVERGTAQLIKKYAGSLGMTQKAFVAKLVSNYSKSL